ncbi:GAF and ANTAR domain-containing protein [Streptomyces sp. NPDC050145]|uniref:GAF and ANTAR domain-containing protein n=1 Tax=Streptomyces sp. NPDC050145 TaxID=3365602 RepID=UPI00378F7EA1
MTDPARALRLADAVLELSDPLDDDFDPAAHLARLATRCAELLDAHAAGVTLAEPDGLPHPLPACAPEQEDAVRELLGADALAGPAREALATGRAVAGVRLTGTVAAARWPAFTALARRHGITTAHAVPLRRSGTPVGALSVLTRSAPADNDAAFAGALADAAGAGLDRHRAFAEQQDLARQLERALTSRVRIEQAKGMLAERWGASPDTAFTVLRRYARSRRMPLDRVAGAVLARELTDDLTPPEPPPAPAPASSPAPSAGP